MTRKDINVILEGYLMSNVQFVTLNSTKYEFKKNLFLLKLQRKKNPIYLIWSHVRLKHSFWARNELIMLPVFLL